MKKLIKYFGVVVIVSLLVLSMGMVFTACESKDLPEGEKTITIILANVNKEIVASVEWTTQKVYLADALDEIMAEGASKISFEVSESEYGKFVDSFSYEETEYKGGDTSFVAIYTSITDINYLSIGYTTVIDEVQYNSCGLGISEMPLFDNEVYVFVIDSFA